MHNIHFLCSESLIWHIEELVTAVEFMVVGSEQKWPFISVKNLQQFTVYTGLF